MTKGVSLILGWVNYVFSKVQLTKGLDHDPCCCVELGSPHCNRTGARTKTANLRKWQEADMGSGIRGKESLYDVFPCFDSLLKISVSEREYLR